MIDHYLRFNFLTSKYLADVRHFTPTCSDTTMHYYGIEDDKHLDKWNYEDFDYTINKYGFRYSPLRDQTDIGAFGCSFTFGEGLPHSRLWHTILQHYTNKSVLNFGIPGRSIETIVNVFCVVSTHIKMEHAILLLPSLDRLQILGSNKGILRHYELRPTSDEELADDIFRAMPEEEIQKIAKNNIYLAEYVAKQRGIKIYFSSWHTTTYTLLKKMRFEYGTLLPEWQPILRDPDKDKARDMQHHGPLHHLYWESLIRPYFL